MGCIPPAAATSHDWINAIENRRTNPLAIPYIEVRCEVRIGGKADIVWGHRVNQVNDPELAKLLCSVSCVSGGYGEFRPLLAVIV